MEGINRDLARNGLLLCCLLSVVFPGSSIGAGNVDTGQRACYDNTGAIACPRPGQPFYGQDGQFLGAVPRYRDNGDDTVSDLNTGLMWSKGLDSRKFAPGEAVAAAARLRLGGYTDWRLPTIKELYSLIDFRGNTGLPGRDGFNSVPAAAVPFINTDFFAFAYGNPALGERYIDAQWLSSTAYVATTMGDMDTVFGVNFADGRIKGYGYRKRGTSRVVKTFHARFVRGETYGVNNFVDNGDGTVTDRSTGLMWARADSGRSMNWQEALAYAEQLRLGGYGDWRLPNAKELQYIVDYYRSPDTTGSPAIDPIFQVTAITNEAGQRDYPFFWTATTHLDGPRPGSHAVYLAFGRAIGQMHGRIMDVHGAGAQRSDPKTGGPSLGYGPQGDAQRGRNFVRCVRGGATGGQIEPIPGVNAYPNRIRLTKAAGSGGRSESHETHRPQAPANEGRIAPPTGGGDGGFVARLDRDGDGRVSRSEFDGPPDRFDIHDANRDGFLSEDEAPKQLPPGPERLPRR